MVLFRHAVDIKTLVCKENISSTSVAEKTGETNLEKNRFGHFLNERNVTFSMEGRTLYCLHST